jgi:hypothetical protein
MTRLGPGYVFFFFPLFYLLTQCFLFFRCGLRATPANDTHRRSPLLAGWFIFQSLGAGSTTAAPHFACYGDGVSLPSPEDDNDAMSSSSSSAPVFEGARNCRSPQLQELLRDGGQRADPGRGIDGNEDDDDS